MSNGLNKVLLIGNLAADSELKVTQGGTSVLKFRLACSETYTDKSGAKQTKTEWVSCVLWGKVGESLHRYLNKGKQVFVEGRLQTTSWEDRDGVKRYKTEVNVASITLLGGGSSPGQNRAPASSPSSGASEVDDYPVEDDDLPF